MWSRTEQSDSLHCFHLLSLKMLIIKQQRLWFWLVWSDFCAFQVFRSSSPITCRRSLSSRLWATSCATGRGSMFAMTTSASVSVPTSIPSATVPSPTSRSWRRLCWGCLKPGLPTIKTLRPLVRRNFPPPTWKLKNYCRCRVCSGCAAAAAVAIAYLSQMYFLLQYGSTILYPVWKKLVVALPGALFIYYWKYKSIPIKPASTR